MDKSSVRVLLVDQHPVVRRGLQRLMAEDATIAIVGETGSADEVEGLIAEESPDVVSLDLMSPPRSGIPLIHRIKQQPRAPRVLVVTGEPISCILEPALRAGCDGMVNKNQCAHDYVEAVHGVARGELWLCPCAQRELVNILFNGSRMRDQCKLESLSDAERTIVVNCASGYTNVEIANRMALPVSAVERLKGHIRDKLDAHRREDLVAFALRVGLLHEEDESALAANGYGFASINSSS